MTELEELKAENAQLKEAHERCLSATRALQRQLDLAYQNFKDLQKAHHDLQDRFVRVNRVVALGDYDVLTYQFTLSPHLFYSMKSEARNEMLKHVFTRAVREMQEQLLSSKF